MYPAQSTTVNLNRGQISSEAGDRWDGNLTGFRGEEEIAFDARPSVYTFKVHANRERPRVEQPGEGRRVVTSAYPGGLSRTPRMSQPRAFWIRVVQPWPNFPLS
jgi:hypothetical protein